MKKVVLYSSVFAAILAAAPMAANAAAPKAPEVAEVNAINAAFANADEFLAASEAVLKEYGMAATGKTLTANLAAFDAAVEAKYADVDDQVKAGLIDDLKLALFGSNNLQGGSSVQTNTNSVLGLARMAAAEGWDDIDYGFMKLPGAGSSVNGNWDAVKAAYETAVAALDAALPPAGPAVATPAELKAFDEAFAVAEDWECTYPAYVDAYEMEGGVKKFFYDEFAAFDAAHTAITNKHLDWTNFVDQTHDAGNDVLASELEAAKAELAALYVAYNDALKALDAFADDLNQKDITAHLEQQARLDAVKRDDSIVLTYSYSEDEMYAQTTWAERQGLARFLGNQGDKVEGKVHTWYVTYQSIQDGINRIFCGDAASHYNGNHNLSYYGDWVVKQLIDEYAAKVEEIYGSAWNQELNGIVVGGYELLEQAKDAIKETAISQEALERTPLPGNDQYTLADYEDYHVAKLAELNKKVADLPAALDKESEAYKNLLAEIEQERQDIKNLVVAIQEADAAYEKDLEDILAQADPREADDYEGYYGTEIDGVKYESQAAAKLIDKELLPALKGTPGVGVPGTNDYKQPVPGAVENVQNVLADVNDGKATLADLQKAVDELNALAERYDNAKEAAQKNDELYAPIKTKLDAAAQAVKDELAKVEEDRVAGQSPVAATRAQEILDEIADAQATVDAVYNNAQGFEADNLTLDSRANIVANEVDPALVDISDKYENPVDEKDLDLDKVVDYIADLNELFDTVPADPSSVDLGNNTVGGFTPSQEVLDARQKVEDLFAEADADLLNPANHQADTDHIDALIVKIKKAIEDLNAAIADEVLDEQIAYYQRTVIKPALDEIKNDYYEALDKDETANGGSYESEAYDEEVGEAGDQTGVDIFLFEGGQSSLGTVPSLIEQLTEDGKLSADDKAEIEQALKDLQKEVEDYAQLVEDANANELGNQIVADAIADAQGDLAAAEKEVEDKVAEIENVAGSLGEVYDNLIDGTIADLQDKVAELKKELEAIEEEAKTEYNEGDLKEQDVVDGLLDEINGYDDKDGNHVDGVADEIEDLLEQVQDVLDRVQELQDAVANGATIADLNDDGAIDEFDYEQLLDTICEEVDQNGDPVYDVLADFNLDGVLDVTDLEMLMNYVWYNTFILPETPVAPTAPSARRANGTVKFVGEIALEANGNNVALALNSNRGVAAMQFDVTVPEGATISNVQTAARAQGYGVSVNAISANTYRVMLTALNTCFAGFEGEVLNFNVNGTGNVTVDNVIAVTNRSNKVAAASVAVEGVATGIAAINTNADANIYGLNGVRLNNLQQGVNIVNGKKVIR